MRFDILAGEVGGEMVEPPRAPALTVATRGADFSTVQQVTLADDADQTSARIDDWGTADAVFRKQACQGLNRRIRINRNHVGRHYIHCSHCLRIAYLPIVNRTTFASVSASVEPASSTEVSSH